MHFVVKTVYFQTVISLIHIFGTSYGAKTVCLDTAADFQPSAWKFNTVNYKYADSSANLPKSFGNLNFLDGNGIWYIEGTGNGKELTMTSDPSLYNSRARSVKIYLRYYQKSPRRITLQPVKSTGAASSPIMLLPLSTGNQWTEATQDINPAQSPIQISAVLSEGQFILFELVVVAVDTSLPKNATAACMDFTVFASQPSVSPRSAGSGQTLTTAKPPSKPTENVQSSPSSCPSNPPPTPVECKCNCNCNCPKNCD